MSRALRRVRLGIRGEEGTCPNVAAPPHPPPPPPRPAPALHRHYPVPHLIRPTPPPTDPPIDQPTHPTDPPAQPPNHRPTHPGLTAAARGTAHGAARRRLDRRRRPPCPGSTRTSARWRRARGSTASARAGVAVPGEVVARAAVAGVAAIGRAQVERAPTPARSIAQLCLSRPRVSRLPPMGKLLSVCLLRRFRSRPSSEAARGTGRVGRSGGRLRWPRGVRRCATWP